MEDGLIRWESWAGVAIKLEHGRDRGELGRGLMRGSGGLRAAARQRGRGIGAARTCAGGLMPAYPREPLLPLAQRREQTRRANERTQALSSRQTSGPTLPRGRNTPANGQIGAARTSGGNATPALAEAAKSRSGVACGGKRI
jgi:hypothetical protein